ncbi:LapA family protein [Anaeroselena agilis]|uniref:LapA family protein n=1 Tax=Anaeroselena agilis TaxID=3063788 RepID=A0ABU3P562_9FIRM|nr:LapA family protein [Selenomonadales bacterium 4137-cl]
MAYLTLLAAAILSFATAFFAVQNSSLVTVNLFTRTFEASLVIVILGAATLGFITALLLGMFVQIKTRYRLFKAERRIAQLEAELQDKQPAKPDEKEEPPQEPPACDPGAPS